MRATLTFVIYTVVGSLLMLASIVAYGLQQGTFDLTGIGHELGDMALPRLRRRVRDQVAALPVPRLAAGSRTASRRPKSSAVLSGIVSKAGLFGLLRIAIPKFPDVVADWRVALLVLASISLVYGSLLAFARPTSAASSSIRRSPRSGLIVIGLLADNDLGSTAPCSRWSTTR